MITKEFSAVLGDFKTALTTSLGKFYPDFDYGTLLKSGEKGADFLRSCVNNAAEYIDGLFVKNILLDKNGFRVDLYINETEGQVYIDFESDT